MPAKFQLNSALTLSQREMLDAIAAGGRGPSDQVVIKMLLAALEEYWNRYGALPSPMRLVPDVPAENLRAVAEAKAEYEAGQVQPGVMFLPDPGHSPAAGSFTEASTAELAKKAAEAPTPKKKQRR